MSSSLGFIGALPSMLSRPRTDLEAQRSRVTIPLTDDFQRVLVLMNAGAGALHLLFAIITLATSQWNFTVPVYMFNNTIPKVAENNTFQIKPSILEAENGLYMMWVVFSFFAISAAAHAGNGFLWRAFYFDQLKHASCPTRWIEYSFSAPLMAILIAYLSGVVMVESLFLIFMLVMVTMFFGYLQEVTGRLLSPEEWEISNPLVRLQPWLLGNVPLIAAWIIILDEYMHLSDNAPNMPAWVFWLVLIELLLFFSFGFVQLVVYMLPPKNYIWGEAAYVALSAIAKITLGLFLGSSVLWLQTGDHLYGNAD